MIFNYNISNYIVHSDNTLREALKKISKNRSSMVFTVDTNNVLVGVLTDGDIRRWQLDEGKLGLDAPVNLVSNKDFTYARVEDEHNLINSYFSNRVKLVPLLDKKGRLQAIASQSDKYIQIGNFRIGDDEPVFIIAEIGNNHNGSVENAKKLIDAANDAGADCVKFQMRHLSDLYRNQADPSDSEADLSTQYTLDLLSRFNLSVKEMTEIFDYCKIKQILCLCTPWDLKSLIALKTYGMPAFKISSADLTNHELVKTIAATGRPIILSTGMSTEDEIIEVVELLNKKATPYILMHCNSTYPTPYKDINLNYIQHLKKLGGISVGYSGHERGFNVAIAAVASGAKIIEKHFTFDRTLEGVDHKVSLLPNEFKSMVDAIRQVEQSIGNNNSRIITQGEIINRETLAKSLVAKCDIAKDQNITSEMITIKSPGKGLQPNKLNKLVGKVASRTIKAGDFFYASDIDGSQTEARNYKFNRPWGLPVRFHDAKKLWNKSNLDMLEYHLSYTDLNVAVKEYKINLKGKALIVHCPELFEGDHILDLCSADEVYRKKSINYLKRVVEITKEIATTFAAKGKPFIITNIGGHTSDGLLPAEKRESLYKLTLESINQIDTRGIEIIPQTMPPFPWHFGGQRFHNLFMEPMEIAKFCQNNGFRVCLDVSHSKLACNHFGWSFDDFINTVGPHTAHLHIADAKGIDEEGLQIGQGEIDFYAMAKQLNKVAPDASFIPEVWQGHNNNGQGFWMALENLERMFG